MKGGGYALVDKEVDLASSKQLLFSLTLHLCSKFHRQPGCEGLWALSQRFFHTAEPSAQSSQIGDALATAHAQGLTSAHTL